MPFYVTAWNFLANNKAAQAAAAVLGGLVIFWFWLSRHDAKVRELQAARAEVKAQKTATKELTKLEERANERIEKADRAAASVPVDDITADSLPDSIRSGLIRD